MPPPTLASNPTPTPFRRAAAADFGTVRRQQRLVGSNDVFALGNRRQDQFFRRFVSPDQLHDDIDCRIVDHIGRPAG